uniref:Uncharacterized protein n=1 Tax=Romanomermis culicivorax TaxID=13658 RepID=A0A915KPM4_ROMCU
MKNTSFHDIVKDKRTFFNINENLRTILIFVKKRYAYWISHEKLCPGTTHMIHGVITPPLPIHGAIAPIQNL